MIEENESPTLTKDDINSRFVFDRETGNTVGGDQQKNLRNLWLISYSDFMTILMIFFLVMYGYAYLMKSSLMQIQNQMVDKQDFSAVVEKMKAKLGDQIKVQDGVEKVTLQLGEKILFASGSAVLKDVANQTLDDLANSIMLVEGAVVVAGHTDNVPIRKGRFSSNWELSAARSFALIESLTERGVPATRLSAWGFGENRPVTDNVTDASRAENRRIEITILKSKTS